MPSEFDQDLRALEAELRKLEIEYNMFFSGQLPRPPWETRGRVEAIIKRYDRGYIQNYADRFRFNTLQQRFTTFADLWERGLRAREEGRPGPFFHPKAADAAPTRQQPEDRILHVTTFSDPVREADKLRELYDKLAEARREVGDEAVPYPKFAKLVQEQVNRLRKGGSPEVAFRVALKEGKVNFTARALKGVRSRDE